MHCHITSTLSNGCCTSLSIVISYGCYLCLYDRSLLICCTCTLLKGCCMGILLCRLFWFAIAALLKCYLSLYIIVWLFYFIDSSGLLLHGYSSTACTLLHYYSICTCSLLYAVLLKLVHYCMVILLTLVHCFMAVLFCDCTLLRNYLYTECTLMHSYSSSACTSLHDLYLCILT